MYHGEESKRGGEGRVSLGQSERERERERATYEFPGSHLWCVLPLSSPCVCVWVCVRTAMEKAQASSGATMDEASDSEKLRSIVVVVG